MTSKTSRQLFSPTSYKPGRPQNVPLKILSRAFYASRNTESQADAGDPLSHLATTRLLFYGSEFPFAMSSKSIRQAQHDVPISSNSNTPRPAIHSDLFPCSQTHWQDPPTDEHDGLLRADSPRIRMSAQAQAHRNEVVPRKEQDRILTPQPSHHLCSNVFASGPIQISIA